MRVVEQLTPTIPSAQRASASVLHPLHAPPGVVQGLVYCGSRVLADVCITLRTNVGDVVTQVPPAHGRTGLERPESCPKIGGERLALVVPPVAGHHVGARFDAVPMG